MYSASLFGSSERVPVLLVVAHEDQRELERVRREQPALSGDLIGSNAFVLEGERRLDHAQIARLSGGGHGTAAHQADCADAQRCRAGTG